MMKDKIYIYIIPLLALIPIFIFRDYTPDNELRYISIIEEAINNGSIFSFYNHTVAYADKPPLYFWLLMVCRMITGENIMLLMGLFTLIPAIVIFYVMNKFSFGAKSTIESSPMLVLLTSVMFIGATVVLRMDMLMVMFIVLALYNFYCLYSGSGSKRNAYFLPINIFLAVFSKGPVGLMVPLISIVLFLAFERKLKNFTHYLGWKQWAIILSLCAIWFTGVAIEGGGEYINNLLVKQTVGRGVNSFHHKEPFYFYLKTFWYAAAPWSLLCFYTICKGFRKGIIQKDTLMKFYSVVILSTFVVMSLVSSKIDIYLLPIYPFFVYLTFILLRKLKVDWFMKLTVVLPSLLFALSPLAIVYIMTTDDMAEFRNATALTLGGLGLLLLAVGGVIGLLKGLRGEIAAACRAVSIALLSAIFVISFAVPKFNHLIGLGELSKRAEAIAKRENIESFAFYQFRSGENMDVYLKTKLDTIETVEELKNIKNSVLFIRQREVRRQQELRDYLQKLPVADSVGDYKIYFVR